MKKQDAREGALLWFCLERQNMLHNATGAKNPTDRIAQFQDGQSSKPNRPHTSAGVASFYPDGVSENRTSYTYTGLLVRINNVLSRHPMSGRVGRPALPWRTSPGARLSRGRAMGTSTRDTKNARTRAEVRRKFGHPWPWMDRELFREHAYDVDRTYEETAKLWATSASTLADWAIKHGLTNQEEASA